MSFDIDSYLSERRPDDVILDFKGSVDSDFINNTLDAVEQRMVDLDEPPKLKKKVYNVLVEALQNLFHHVDSVPRDYEGGSGDRFGMLFISRDNGAYTIVTGNFILKEKIEKLEEKIKRINSSSKEEIKELYKFILNHQKISEKGGGGLGLVDIARKTGNRLKYLFEDYNESYSFFYLEIKINSKAD